MRIVIFHSTVSSRILCAVLAHEPLRVSLQDLHSAGSKGKWWLVGAAWGGDPLIDRQDRATNVQIDPETKETAVDDNVLLKLARKQGMNTDIRRSIFVVLMSSDVSFCISTFVSCRDDYTARTTSMLVSAWANSVSQKCNSEKSYGCYSTAVGMSVSLSRVSTVAYRFDDRRKHIIPIIPSSANICAARRIPTR